MWWLQGAGTAIGELPPYFMARAARQSGADPDDEDYEEFEEMLEQAEGAQVRHAQTPTRSRKHRRVSYSPIQHDVILLMPPLIGPEVACDFSEAPPLHFQ